MAAQAHVHQFAAIISGYQCTTCGAKLSDNEVGTVAMPAGHRGHSDIFNYVWNSKH